jgi:hypothetical protein
MASLTADQQHALRQTASAVLNDSNSTTDEKVSALIDLLKSVAIL